MTTVQITLPDELAQKAASAGLLSPEAIAAKLREQLRRQAADSLRAMWERTPAEALTPEIEQEIEELAHSLSYAKFSERIKGFGTSVDGAVARYAALVSLVTPAAVPRVVANDPGDDHVIAAAVAARAVLIVSGDRKQLLPIGSYERIGIVSAVQALATLGVTGSS